jgi:hypothetical protein
MPNRVEREIEEILTKLERPEPGRRPVKLRRSFRSRVRAALNRIPRPRWAARPGDMMLWGIGLILLGILLNALGFASGAITRWVVIAGLTLFFTSFVLGFFSKGGSAAPRGDIYWRGERYARGDLRGPSSFDRLRAWFQGRNRRRW